MTTIKSLLNHNPITVAVERWDERCDLERQVVLNVEERKREKEKKDDVQQKQVRQLDKVTIMHAWDKCIAVLLHGTYSDIRTQKITTIPISVMGAPLLRRLAAGGRGHLLPSPAHKRHNGICGFWQQLTRGYRISLFVCLGIVTLTERLFPTHVKR